MAIFGDFFASCVSVLHFALHQISVHHSSSRLATINICQKLSGGGCALCSGVAGSPSNTKSLTYLTLPYLLTYLHTKCVRCCRAKRFVDACLTDSYHGEFCIFNRSCRSAMSERGGRDFSVYSVCGVMRSIARVNSDAHRPPPRRDSVNLRREHGGHRKHGLLPHSPGDMSVDATTTSARRLRIGLQRQLICWRCFNKRIQELSSS